MNSRELRVALATIGISQAEMARLLGRSANTVTSWVNANEMPAEVRLFIWIAMNHDLDTAKEAMRP